ncbi:MAG: hypothetical protein Q8P18_32550 [Pseudomonadota bacterium]|nr:hypothetical protein [Pseudomonadota bacterium]
MTHEDPTPLARLLATLFDTAHLERLVRGLGPFVHAQVDWEGERELVAASAAAVLLRQEPLHDAVFGALLRDSPGQADLIAGAYEAKFGRRLSLGGAGLPLDERHPAMSEDLLVALDRCAGHCLATGWGDLCTTTVFQVYRFAQPWVVAALPAGALREVEPEYTGQARAVARAGLLASPCVGRSLAGLCAHAPPGVRVTFHDLFFDLARFGTGRSVQRLRDHGVDQPELRRFTTILGFGSLTRHGPLAAA